MQWGTMMHFVMERRYRAIQAGATFVLEEAIAALTKAIWADPVYGRCSPHEVELQIGMVQLVAQEYLDYYTSDLQANWWAVEKPFAAQLGAVTQRGKPDIIELRDDGYWLWDTKTKGYYSPEQTKTLLPRDLQLMSYARGIEKTTNITIVGVVYNIIRQPQHRKKMGETVAAHLERVQKDISLHPEDYFIRLRYKITPKTRTLVEESMLVLANEYAGWVQRGSPPVENHQSCFMFGDKRCPFLNACYHGNYDELMHGELFSELNEDGDNTAGRESKAEGTAK